MCGDASHRARRVSLVFSTQQQRQEASRRGFLFLVFFDAAVSLLQSKEDTRDAEGRWEA